MEKLEQLRTKMVKIRMLILIVCSDNRATISYDALMKKLEETFCNLSCYYTNIERCDSIIVPNVDQLKRVIISMVNLNTIDVILIVGLASIKNDITTIIIKIRDTEDTIGKLFATIPVFLTPTNKSFLKFTCRNNTLIFSVTGNESEILNYVQKTADAMILSTYLLQLTIEHKNNVLNHPPVIDENVSIIENTNQETCQSTVSVEDALSRISQITTQYNLTRESEFVHIKNAFRRILLQSISSSRDVPSFSVATKRGYAVRAQKEGNEIEMKVEADESSEISPVKLDPDTSSEVDKGEHIPLGATAVIPAENVISSYDEEGLLIKSTSHTIKYGQNVKFLGSDIKRGELIIKNFTRIDSNEITLLAACNCAPNCTHVRVLKKLSIGVLTIGNKLQEPGQSLKPEHSYDCNRAILISLLKENGFDCDTLDFGITNIDETLITQNIRAALETVDLLVTTGCSSDKDCLKIILKTYFKAILHFENVDMKPGKSTAFASCNFKGKPKIILCLPRNPASVFVTANLFLLPLVYWMHFLEEDRATICVKLEQKLLLHSRPRYVCATLSWNKKECFAKVTCEQEKSINNNLSDIINANALLTLPPKTSENSTLEVPSFVPAMLIKFSTLTS